MRYVLPALVMIGMMAGCGGKKKPIRPIGIGPTKGYVIGKPGSWLEKRGYRGTDVTYFSPAEGETDKFRENINVVTEMLPPKLTAAQYLDYSIVNMKKAHARFVVETKAEVTIGPAKGWYLKYKYVGRDGKMSNEAYMFERKGVIYIITCVSLESTYARYKPAFDKIVGTFRLSGSR